MKSLASPRTTPNSLPIDSLAYALLGAAKACVSVRNGQTLPEALATLAKPASPEGKGVNAAGAIQDLAYRTMRARGRADAWLGFLAKRALTSALLRELLVVSIALLDAAISTAESAPYPAFTLVNQAVEAAAATPELKAASGFVNAILRNLLREHAALLPQVLQSDEARWNYPDWWIARLRRAYPTQWQELLALGDLPPPLSLRVNRRKTSLEEYLQTLARNGLDAQAIGPDALRLAVPVPVTRIPGFAGGLASVQDEAAQRAAALLDVRDGLRVLDACAAPGGKTGHLLECAELDLTALDVDARRLKRVQENLDRLGLMSPQVKLQVGSATQSDWWDGQLFDRILADVPCSASGIVRRHPDIRWLRRESDLVTLARIQQQILDCLWQLLKPGGKLLLVTCSLFPEESTQQAESFGQRNPQAKRLDAPGQLLPTPPLTAHTSVDHDGLFYALFEKTAG